jgi:Zn-dependent protease
MRWSLRVARVRGIDIRVHATFVFLLLLGAVQWGLPYGALGAVFGVLLLSAVFACVALHELGHGVVAQSVGVGVREILLLPIGGVARLSKDPSRPVDELLIAVAGPAVNLVIACGIFLAGRGLFGSAWFDEGLWYAGLVLPPSALSFVVSLLWANVGLAVFNMLPALPMDGGRVLRAVLSMLFGQLRATAIASSVGRVLAVGLGVLGVLGENPILVLIAVFVFIAAGREREAVEAKAWLSKFPARALVSGTSATLEPGSTLAAAAQIAMQQPASVFLVILGDGVVGAITRAQIAAGLERRGPAAFVAEFMSRDLPLAPAADSLYLVHQAVMQNGGRPVLLLEGQRVVGAVCGDDIARALTLLRPGRRVHRASRATPLLPISGRERTL